MKAEISKTSISPIHQQLIDAHEKNKDALTAYIREYDAMPFWKKLFNSSVCRDKTNMILLNLQCSKARLDFYEKGLR